MAGINRVGHVVLYVSDVDAAIEFYRGKVGMELVRYNEERGLAFMSFGTQHHDLGLFRVRGEPDRGHLGLSHIAFVISGGTEELREVHDRLAGKGVEILQKIDYGYTQSFYINDPDGNRVEIYCDLKAPLEGKQFLAERPGSGQPFEFAAVPEGVTATRPA